MTLSLLILLGGCSQDTSLPPSASAIFRTAEEHISSPPLQEKALPLYPWQGTAPLHLRPITREFFRCKGSSLNPPHRIIENGKEKDRIWDCGGKDRHSLPIRNGKEHIYPILIELLNYLQTTLERPVTITSGHRCPMHEAYIMPNRRPGISKHTIGAEVAFFVQGLEHTPDVVIKKVMEFYPTNPRYNGQKEYVAFSRFSKPTDVATPPWMNKEILIKLYKVQEGRNLDNRHPFPYISIQVRWERDRNVQVLSSWADAQHYLRK